MSRVSVAGPASPSPLRQAGAYDRLFYGGMALALGLTVLAGFASTYYLRFFGGGPRATLTGGPFTALVHVHGALFTAWVLLFIVQTALVASRRVAVHRRLGLAGAALAAAMVVAGTLIAIATAARGSAPPGVDPLAFLAIPLFDMVLFGGFVTAALVLRRDKETHKRLMLLAYVSIVVAAVAVASPGSCRRGPRRFSACRSSSWWWRGSTTSCRGGACTRSTSGAARSSCSLCRCVWLSRAPGRGVRWRSC